MTTRQTRPISWIKAARKEFEKFPPEAQTICLSALTIAAADGKADIAKPLKGMGAGIFEIALPFRGNAFRVVYAVQVARRNLGSSRISEEVGQGRIKTPMHEIELIQDRLRRLKEMIG